MQDSSLMSFARSVLYLSYVPPTYEYGTRPCLRWVLSQGVAQRDRQFQKCLGPRRHSPFSGRLRRRAINPTPPKRVEAWGEAPWGQRWCIQWWNTPDRTVQHATTAGRERPTTGHKRTLARACHLFVAASHQTRLDTRSKARRPIKVGIKGREVGNEPRLEPCLSVLLISSLSAMWAWWGKQFLEPKCESGTYASLRLKLDAWSSAVQRGQKCSSPTRRLPSRSWGPIRPRVCSWFRAPIRHECQTAQLKSRGRWKGLADITKVLWHTAQAAWI